MSDDENSQLNEYSNTAHEVVSNNDVSHDEINHDDVSPTHTVGYMPKEEFVWHVEYDDIVVFYMDKQDPETGEVIAKHVCTLQKLGRTDSNGDCVLGSISTEDYSLRFHRPVEPGYCRKEHIPFTVDINYKPDDYQPKTRKCGSCGKSVNTEASRSPRTAVSNGRCPHCGGSLTNTRR